MNNNYEKAQSQYERKLARQRQLELMEAAASGTAPSMELDISDISDNESTSIASGLRSRNETARRYYDENPRSPTRSHAPLSGNLFDIRGRADGLPSNTGINLMDHTTGVYAQPETRKDRFFAGLSGLFRTSDLYDAASRDDWEVYNRKRLSTGTSMVTAMLYNRRCRSIIMLVLALIILVLVVTVTTLHFKGPSEKVLRQQNNKRFNSIMDALINQGSTTSEAFLDYKSPEHHALRWVAYSDPAKLSPDDPMITTRYALAVFFYNSFLVFEESHGRQKPVEIGVKQWEGVPNPGWTRKDYWLSEKGVCMWYGVHCAEKKAKSPTTGEEKMTTQYDANEPVLAIKIRSNRIGGKLPAELKEIQSLKLLDLASNKITGSFPSELARMSNLEFLHLSDNRITGKLPTEIGLMESIKTLDFSKCALTGQLPTQINRLYNLEILQLDHNNLLGEIPDLSDTKMKVLHLHHNSFSGFFPISLAILRSLEELLMNNNKISGTIPNEIESIRGLERLDVSFNGIKGIIPQGMFDQMSHLRQVSLSYNEMTGTIPSETSALVQLEILNFDNNNFKGTLPGAWGQIKSLQKMHLSENNLSGNLPSELGNLDSIKEIWAEGNKFTGPIPSELGLATSLELLYLERNKFTGSVPYELGDLSNLKTLRIQGNEMKGEMPAQVCFLKSSARLAFISADCMASSNLLECELPTCCSECY
jgi:Leucine-rich repeat (LRR) protein